MLLAKGITVKEQDGYNGHRQHKPTPVNIWLLMVQSSSFHNPADFAPGNVHWYGDAQKAFPECLQKKYERYANAHLNNPEAFCEKYYAHIKSR